MLHKLSRLLAIPLLAALTLAPQPATATHQAAIWDGPACVTRVVDGDTVAINGLDHTVRLAGIQAPELSAAFGRAAWLRLGELVDLAACRVWIEPATPSWDTRTQRYRAHLWIEDTSGWYLVQEALVDEGLALVDYANYRPDDYSPQLLQAQANAEQRSAGVWSGSTGSPPQPAPNTQPSPTPQPVPTARPVPTAQPVATARPVPTAQPTPASTAQPTPAPDVYYANCDAARRAGAAPLRRGQPGYRPALDRDGDGVACE